MQIRETRDSGYFFVDAIAQWKDLTSFTHFVDSNTVWRASGKRLFVTRDKGLHWDTVLPVDTLLNPRYFLLQPTDDDNRFYVIGGAKDSSDFLRTTDAGKTWKNYAPLTNSRIYRVAEQGIDSLWLLVARQMGEPYYALWTPAIWNGDFADTLYYTTNGGESWQKDLTFEGDTVLDIQFHSPANGFVISLRDSTVKFSRYVPASSKVDDSYSYSGRGMHIHPNPASEELKFYARLGGKCQVRILDVLGRMVYEEPKDLVHSQWSTLRIPDHLPDGVYFLELSRGEARAGQRFLIQW
jgi:hypothetical protein